MGAPIYPVWEQNSFAFYAEGTESGSTIIGTADNQQTIDTDTNFQCRLLIEEIASPPANKDPLLTTKLQYNLEGGGWTDVSGTTPIQYVASTALTATVTTSRLGSGTFVVGNVYEAANNLDETSAFGEVTDTYTNCLYSLTIDSAQVADDDEILLRAVEGDGTLFGGTYVNADINVNEPTPAYIDQDTFRARNDNGNETAATWIATANTNWTQTTDENFRVRFLLQNTGESTFNPNGTNSYHFRVEYKTNAGAWTEVGANGTTAEDVVFALSGNIATQGIYTSQQISSGTFTIGILSEENAVVGTYHPSYPFNASTETETELCLQIVAANVSASDTIQLRCVGYDGTDTAALDLYTNTPTITVTLGAITHDGTAIFDGGASFVGTGSHIVAAAATFIGNASFVGVGGQVHSATAAFTGTSSLVGVGEQITLYLGVGSFVGGGALVGSAATVRAATANFIGLGVFAGSGQQIYAASSSFLGDGTLVGLGEYLAGTTVYEGMAAFIGGASLVAVGESDSCNDDLAYHLATYDPDTFLVGDEIVSGTSTFVHTSTSYAKNADGVWKSFGEDKRVVKGGRYVSDSAVYADNGSGTLLDPLPMMVWQPAATNRVLYSNDLSQWTLTQSNVSATFNQVGLTGAANSASIVSDTSDWSSRGTAITYPSSTLGTLKIYLKIQASYDSSCGIVFDDEQGRVVFNPVTGALVDENGNANDDLLDQLVIEHEDWWEILLEIALHSSTTLDLYIHPANNNAADDSFDWDATGSVVIGNAELYTGIGIDDAKLLGPIFTTSEDVSTDETINTYPAANWSNSEGPIYIIHDYKGIDEDILLNDDVAILYVTNDVLYLDDGTNTTSIAYATEGEHEIGIALDATNGNMRLIVDGTWAEEGLPLSNSDGVFFYVEKTVLDSDANAFPVDWFVKNSGGTLFKVG